MIRKLISLSFAALIVASCSNSGQKENSSKADGTSGAIKVEFAALTENPGEYIGKVISVEGKVVHVCMHSGKKLFITGKDPDIRLYIQAGEEMPKFPTELLGSEVEVQGILTKLESGAEQPGKEGMHSAEGEIMASANTDSCPTEKALAGQAVLSDLMMVYNKHMVIN
jgi:hypothetical protein